MVVSFWETLKETKHGTLLPVHVVPGSKSFEISGLEDWNLGLRVRLREKAEKGKANQELVKKLGKFFETSVEIVKGEKSSKKVLLVHAEKYRVLKSLSSL